MSALSVQPAYPIFTEIDGAPLESGYIWIGSANLDPQNNPINVYWDAALTIQAVQPIRTLNGYPSNSGTPARLYVNSDYSIRVLNKKAVLVYSAPAATERYSDIVVSNNAEKVIYEPPFTNGVSTNVENKLSQVISIKDFGAIGDGIQNDTSSIQAALNYAGTIGNAGVFVPAGIFLFTSTLTIPSGVRLYGAGSERGVGGLKSNVTGAPSINVLNGFYQKIENLNIFHATPAISNTAIQIIDNDGLSGTDPAQYFRAKNLRIIGHVTGVRISSESTWCLFEDIIIEQCSSVAFSVSNANLTVFERCISDFNASAWFLENTTKTILNSCTAQTCTSTSTAAINIINCSNVEINHLWTERNEFHNVHVRGTSRMTRITEMLNQGAGFTSGTGRGIFVDGTCSNTIIDGGWHGNNATEDISIGSTTSGNTLINPRSTTTLTYTDASGTALFISKNMNGISGISGTSIPSKNLRGIRNISGASNVSTVTFSNQELNTSYFVTASVNNTTGSPAVGSTNLYIDNRTVNGFDIILDASPGVGNSVDVSWILIR